MRGWCVREGGSVNPTPTPIYTYFPFPSLTLYTAFIYYILPLFYFLPWYVIYFFINENCIFYFILFYFNSIQLLFLTTQVLVFNAYMFLAQNLYAKISLFVFINHLRNAIKLKTHTINRQIFKISYSISCTNFGF